MITAAPCTPRQPACRRHICASQHLRQVLQLLRGTGGHSQMCWCGRYSYDHKDFSFKVKCKSDFTWYFEDKDHYNKHAPVSG